MAENRGRSGLQQAIIKLYTPSRRKEKAKGKDRRSTGK